MSHDGSSSRLDRPARCLLLIGLVVTAASCGSSPQVSPSLAIGLAKTYGRTVFVEHDCAGVKTLLSSGSGATCDFFSDLPADESFVPHESGYYHHCLNFITGGRESRPCAWLTLVGHPEGSEEWQSGLLEVFFSRHGGKLLIDAVTYGNGSGCPGTAPECASIAHLWEARAKPLRR